MKSYAVTIAYASPTGNCQRATFSLYTSSVADAIHATRPGNGLSRLAASRCPCMCNRSRLAYR